MPSKPKYAPQEPRYGEVFVGRMLHLMRKDNPTLLCNGTMHVLQRSEIIGQTRTLAPYCKRCIDIVIRGA